MQTLTRNTAIEALRALATADALIREKMHTTNHFRQGVIKQMEEELDVKITVTKDDN